MKAMREPKSQKKRLSDASNDMRESKVQKKMSCILALPNDLLLVILSKLGFRDTIRAGMVCRDWERLLHGGTAAAKHWEVVYSVSDVARRTALTTCLGPSPPGLIALINRCGTSLLSIPKVPSVVQHCP